MEEKRYATPAVEKAFAVLELVSRHSQGLRMVDVVEQLALPKTSAFVLLRSLERLGYLSRDGDNRYRLTFKLFALGMRAMSQADLVGVARTHLDQLVERTGLTVHLAGLELGEAVYLSKVDGPGLVKFDTYVGKRAPAHLTAVGKAILAYLAPDDLTAVMNQLDFAGGTTRAIHSPRLLRQELTHIRRIGYAVEDGEEVEGVRCVGAAIRREGEGVIASIGVIGLRTTLDQDNLAEIGAEVVRAAQAIAREVVPATKPA